MPERDYGSGDKNQMAERERDRDRDRDRDRNRDRERDRDRDRDKWFSDRRRRSRSRSRERGRPLPYERPPNRSQSPYSRQQEATKEDPDRLTKAASSDSALADCENKQHDEALHIQSDSCSRSRSASPDRSSFTSSENPEMVASRVYVGRLPTDKMARDDLKDLFTPFGKVIGYSLHKGYGFVQFESPSIATEARIKMDGHMFKGTPIIVRVGKGGREREFWDQRNSREPNEGASPSDAVDFERRKDRDSDTRPARVDRRAFTGDRFGGPRQDRPAEFDRDRRTNDRPGPSFGRGFSQAQLGGPRFAPASRMLGAFADNDEYEPKQFQKRPSFNAGRGAGQFGSANNFDCSRRYNEKATNDFELSAGGGWEGPRFGGATGMVADREHELANYDALSGPDSATPVLAAAAAPLGIARSGGPPRHTTPLLAHPVLPQQLPQQSASVAAVLAARRPAASVVDCYVLAITKSLLSYCEMIEARLRRLGMFVELQLLSDPIEVSPCLNRAAQMSVLYCVTATAQNEMHRSVTVNILQGTVQGN